MLCAPTWPHALVLGEGPAEWEQAHSPLDLGNDGPKIECRGDLKGSRHGQQSHVPGDKVGTTAKHRPILRRLKKLKLQRVMAMCVLSHVSHIHRELVVTKAGFKVSSIDSKMLLPKSTGEWLELEARR